jgi:hypothetical protein
MKTLSAVITSLAFAGPLTVASAVHAQDKASPSQPTPAPTTSPSTSSGKQDMTMDQLPSAVKTTVQREGKNKNIESITKSTDAKGAAAYEVKFLDGSKETTLDISASGKVTSRHTGAAGDSSQSSPTKPDGDMKAQPRSTEPSTGDAKPDTSGDPQVPQPQNPPTPK